jgi:hypothetical protein
MRVLAWIVGILAALAGAYYGLGFLLPNAVTVERQIEIAKSPPDIFPLINDLHSFDRWWLFASLAPASPKGDNPGPQFSGPASGVGQKVIWLARTDADRGLGTAGELEITQSLPDRSIVMNSELFGSLRSQFRFDLAGSGDKTVVKWDADVALDTVTQRWFGYFFLGWTVGVPQQISLLQLKQLAETGHVSLPLPPKAQP